LSGIKSGGFAFGSGGNSPSQTTQSSSGNLPVSQSSDKPGSLLFGTLKSSGGGAFGSSENQSTGLFGSVGSPAPQMPQPSSGIFQTQSQTDGIFGSGSSLSTQPAGGAFGGSTSAQPMFAFGSTSSGTSVQQPVTGPFGAATPFQFGAPNNNTSASVGKFYSSTIVAIFCSPVYVLCLQRQQAVN
jgi:hypothetical protein